MPDLLQFRQHFLSRYFSQRYSLPRFFLQRYYNWLDRRIPITDEIQLSHKQLFIFPSKAGFGFIFLIMMFWLLATNYENNLIFALCFLLSSLFVVAIHLTHGNLSGIVIRPVKAQSVFAGQNAAVTLSLNQYGKRIRDNLILHFNGGEPVVVAMDHVADCTVTLLVPTIKRGYLKPGRLTIESYYPFGLLRAWTSIQFNLNGLIYPKPVEGVPLSRSGEQNKEGAFTGDQGSEDYVGLKRYQIGDSLRHIAWKHYAREQGLWSKHYGDQVSQELVVDWDAFPGMHREQRLSRMCWQVVDFNNSNVNYGLKLPGISIRPNRGHDHYLLLLRHLALFEIDMI